MIRRKTEAAKDWTPSDRAVVLALRLASGGWLRVHDVAEEFSISRRQVYRELAMLERHLPLAKERLDDGTTVFRRGL
ncbi:MAG: hypothetical protein IH614_13735 [Desulfuromonadales bacterium]|nr:hypothetical protein [Desulfuromonadales bacterium]